MYNLIPTYLILETSESGLTGSDNIEDIYRIKWANEQLKIFTFHIVVHKGGSINKIIDLFERYIMKIGNAETFFGFIIEVKEITFYG